MLMNAFHLAWRPGEKTVQKLGGLHKFSGWKKPILTDSGGYQIFSLPGLRKITDEGALFASMPQARATRVLGTDERIIGIPKNCDEARAARIAPMARGTGFYTERLDIDRNGLACEPNSWDIFAKF